MAWILRALLSSALLWFAWFSWIGDGEWSGYLNAAGLWIGLGVLGIGALFIVRENWAWAAGSFIFAAAILYEGFAFTLLPPQAPAGSFQFRLVSASLRTRNKNMEDAARVLLANRPDVLVLQEVAIIPFEAALKRQGDIGWNFVSLPTRLIGCRCPIRSIANDDILGAELSTSSGVLQVWNVRAPKNYRDPAVNRRYFAKLTANIDPKRATILAGDYNATPWNDGYAAMEGVARDALKEASWGPGLTYPTQARRGGLIPLIAIDHAFITGPLVATRFAIGKNSSGADHFPIIVDLALSQIETAEIDNSADDPRSQTHKWHSLS